LSMVLDYGCGGSPYRPLFGNCTYHRADLCGGNNLDFEYGPDSKLPLELSGYDCILSSQALEHVQNPEAYLRECYRLLRPGGNLVLTTHGLFEDHACPYDYWRWTVYGLKRLVENSGLNVEAAKKLTTGPRCAVFLVERQLHWLRFGAAGAYGKLLSAGVQRGGGGGPQIVFPPNGGGGFENPAPYRTRGFPSPAPPPAQRFTLCLS